MQIYLCLVNTQYIAVSGTDMFMSDTDKALFGTDIFMSLTVYAMSVTDKAMSYTD